MNTFREMLVWQKAMDMVVEIYSYTKDFPKDEIYGLTSQIRRCAVSIPSEISFRLNYISEGKYNHLYEQTCEIERMLVSLIHKLHK